MVLHTCNTVWLINRLVKYTPTGLLVKLWPMPLVKLTTPASDLDRMTTVALLEGHGIDCFGPGEGFNTIYPGAQLGSRSALAIYVDEDQFPEAEKLLAATPLWDPKELDPG